MTPTVAPTGSPTATPAEAGWCSPAGQRPQNFLIVGYLPDYREIDGYWGNCLTDLVLFSAEALPDGGLDTRRLDEYTLQTMRWMKARYGTRIHVSVGGWGRSEGFAPMVTDPDRLAAFVDHLAEYARQNDLDGVDLDWEFPQEGAELDGYLALIEALKARGLIVSVALVPTAEAHLAAYAAADRIHLMSYDRGPQHATYEQAVLDLATAAASGLPRSRLILGIPVYGRETEYPYIYHPYNEIVAQFRPLPEDDLAGGIFFNGVRTTQDKACYAFDNSFGGVMLWELGQDSPGDPSLMQAVYQAIANQCKP